ncbi:DUF357 domain-containing protein [Candidatus Woesearchaeota archaeon]|nr:DUF357 domain-containing protein [Candidatus Woesearchaeota archaeon]MBT4368360.1 DUF357 domain-containing protein [Candidatus Woesearchaeota archaeon]MBT4712849.1 DUF357 domain-containing protein [Candidatus Woesearchaeota archaeon]MBT6639761.1 DUF357 domain-containing protein [Candidatus Woesearchaeota archaeon]MBT7133933.1 DUF357 domain-containing protein [Candidatus Woesearchaeota archaeon]
MDKITDKKLAKYFDVTGRALEKVKKAKCKKGAEVVLDMAERYYSDAGHFRNKNDYVNAFACLNYAHGWLDCGATLELFDVHDNKLFTVD